MIYSHQNASSMSLRLLFRPFAPLHNAAEASDDTHRLAPQAFLALLEHRPFSQPPAVSAPSLFALVQDSVASPLALASPRPGICLAPGVLPKATASKPASLSRSTAVLARCSRTVPESTIRSSL